MFVVEMTLRRRMDETSKAWALLTALFVATFAWVAPPARAEAAVTVTATPTELSLVPGGTGRGALVLSNAGNAAANVTLDTFVSDPSVEVELDRMSAAVPAGSSEMIAFEVTKDSESSGQNITVAFVTRSSSGGLSGSMVTSLVVKPATSPDLIALEVRSSVTNVNENRPGVAALVVENLRESRVTVDSLEVRAPADVTVTIGCPEGDDLVAPEGSTTAFTDCPVEIEARRHAVLEVRLTTDDTVVPGPRDALFVVTAASKDSALSDAVVATFSFTADVFAESELLKALGVPIFLLLPGMVISVVAWFLITRASLWRRAATRAQVKEVPPLLTTGVVGVALSLLMAYAYPRLTKMWPGSQRDYLAGYGFSDFYYVFGYSFAVAIALWVVSMLVFLLNLLRRWLFVPMPGDTAPALLRKLGLRHVFRRGLDFPQVQVSEKSGLRLAGRAAGKALVGPQVTLRVASAKRAMVEEALTRPGRAALLRLWRTVKRTGANAGFEAGGIGKVQLVDAAEPTPNETRIATVEVE